MNDIIKINCGLCEDLAPLVEDGVAGEDSTRSVLSHIAACPECRKKYPALVNSNMGTLPKQPEGPSVPEKNDFHVISKIREKVSLWFLVCIIASLIIGVLIAISGPSKPWLTILVFPLICGLVYFINSRIWKWVPLAAALFWILITLLMDIGTVTNWKTAVFDSVISAIFPFLFSYIGALAAALLKYAFKGEFR